MQIIEVAGRFARCQLLLGSDGVTLVDAGSDPKATSILAALAAIGLSVADVRRVVLTHGDGDHIAGARLVQERSGAEVFAHERELAYLAGRMPAGFPLAKRAFGVLGSRLSRPHVTRVVAGGGADLGDIELVHAPGHTPGHLVVYAGSTLLAGDAFRTGNAFAEVPAAMTVDRRTSWETIRTLARRPVEQAYSGHGPPADEAHRRLQALVDRLPSQAAQG